MGLTIHYTLQGKPGCTQSDALRMITRLHQRAGKLPFDRVGTLLDVHVKTLGQSGAQGLVADATESIQHNGLYHNVPPARLFAFTVQPGEGCEMATFGLASYPKTIQVDGRRVSTGLVGWSWSSFCKTIYAGNPEYGGAPNFVRCHLAVIALLDEAKLSGLQVDVHDEGDFWQQRDVLLLGRHCRPWTPEAVEAVRSLQPKFGRKFALGRLS